MKTKLGATRQVEAEFLKSLNVKESDLKSAESPYLKSIQTIDDAQEEAHKHEGFDELATEALLYGIRPDKPWPRSGLPTDPKERKDIPIYSGCFMYFPDALIEVAICSKTGNDQHNPGLPLGWDRSKSGDELDALSRHLMQAGTIDSDGIRHSTKVAWRALANLQKEIENG